MKAQTTTEAARPLGPASAWPSRPALLREPPRIRPLSAQRPVKPHRACVYKQSRRSMPLPGNLRSAPPTTASPGDAEGAKPQGPGAPRAEASSAPRAAACPPQSAPGVVVPTSNPLLAECGAAWWAVEGRGLESKGEGVADRSEHLEVASPGSHAEELVSSLRCSRDFGRER